MSGIEEAKKWLGIDERSGRLPLMSAFKQAGINLDPKTTPWCAAFVNAMEVAAGHEGNGQVNARSFLTYGKGIEEEHAMEGDILIFSRGNNSWQGHVTYFVEWNDENNTVKVLGGNQADKVCYAYYNQSNIIGIRRAE